MDKKQKQSDELEIVQEGEEISDKLKKIKEELKECRKKAEEYLVGWQRAKADLINVRKEEEKNRESIIKYANEKLLSEILNTLDSLDKALSDPGLDEKHKSGFRHIRNQLVQIIKVYGVEELNPIGQKFNPAEHESIVIEDVARENEDHKVLEEIQKGYRIYDKVLRPARVKIGIYTSKDGSVE